MLDDISISSRPLRNQYMKKNILLDRYIFSLEFDPVNTSFLMPFTFIALSQDTLLLLICFSWHSDFPTVGFSNVFYSSILYITEHAWGMVVRVLLRKIKLRIRAFLCMPFLKVSLNLDETHIQGQVQLPGQGFNMCMEKNHKEKYELWPMLENTNIWAILKLQLVFKLVIFDFFNLWTIFTLFFP